MKREDIIQEYKLNRNLQVYIIKEDEYFVSYCPLLDISSYGKSIEEAEKSFLEALEICEEYLEEKFNKEMLEL